MLGLYDAGERVVADAAAITTPIQLLISGSDWVVHHRPQHDFYNRLGSRIKERHVLKGFYHDTLGEAGREQAFAHIRRFIRACFAGPYAQTDVTDAHIHSASRREADELATPLSPFTPRGAYWAAQRRFTRLGRHWTTGVKLGVDTGFDSGSTLDYVYQNRPQGRNAFGRAIDRYYLDAVGWRGIRQRKANIGQAIQTAMQHLREKGKPVHVLDIASGHGRYVLDALAAEALPESVRLRDYSPINVAAGQALIAERGDAGKIWASMLKEAIKRRRPDFNEAHFGFRAFGNLLDEAQNRGLLEVGRDEKSGAFVARSSAPATRVESSPEVSVVPETATLEEANPAPEAKRRGRGGNRRVKKEEKEVSGETAAAEPATASPEPAVAEGVVVMPEKKSAARSRKPRKPKAAPEGVENS